MLTSITTLDVRQRLGELLNRVSLRHDRFLISRRGRPLAAMVPVELLDQMQRAARLQLLEILDRQGGELSEAEADALADEAKHQARG